MKTTDTYRINLDTISEYRKKLIKEERIDKDSSSILVVVGRDDTGDLEAQIRGSRHAWDIRVISTDYLLKLLSIKEALNDQKVIHQISEILKPKEYTRLDSLIELMFVTSQDIQTYDKVGEPIEDEEAVEIQIRKRRKSSEEKVVPVSFYDDCVSKIQIKLNTNLIKRSRISFTNKDKSLGLICAISKKYKQGQNDKYWFAFHPHQMEFLDSIGNSFVAYGCGASDKIVLIPYSVFKPLLDSFWTTEKKDRMYWHVVIHERNGKLLLAQPNIEKGTVLDITQYKI